MSKKLKILLIVGGVFVLLIIAHALPGTIIEKDDPFVTKKEKRKKRKWWKRKKKTRINPALEQHKKLAELIQGTLNKDKHRRVEAECEGWTTAVYCKLRFDDDVSNGAVIGTTRKLAEVTGEKGIGANVIFVGMKGHRRVCTYEWELFSQRVKGKVY